MKKCLSGGFLVGFTVTFTAATFYHRTMSSLVDCLFVAAIGGVIFAVFLLGVRLIAHGWKK